MVPPVSVCPTLPEFRSKSVKAIEAAIHSRQWNKVMQIVETQEEVVAQKYYKVIAEHYSSSGELAQAER